MSGKKHRRKRKSRRRSQRRRNRQIAFRVILLIVIIVFIIWGIQRIRGAMHQTMSHDVEQEDKTVGEAPDFEVELLDINEYSRPGIAMEQVNGIVIHYTANPGTTAQQNRDYFNGLKDSHLTKASSHFVIGLDGEIIQCIPTAEIAYASNDRNYDTVAIECCIEDDTGEFNRATYDALIHLTAFLCGKFNLGVDDVIRHYDITGKDCPKYYVEHEEAWTKLKDDISGYIEKYGVQGTQEGLS